MAENRVSFPRACDSICQNRAVEPFHRSFRAFHNRVLEDGCIADILAEDIRVGIILHLLLRVLVLLVIDGDGVVVDPQDLASIDISILGVKGYNLLGKLSLAIALLALNKLLVYLDLFVLFIR